MQGLSLVGILQHHVVPGRRPNMAVAINRLSVAPQVATMRPQAAVSLQGAAPTPWGRWTRQWTAEENRHGDAMNKYMYLSGKVNLKVRNVCCLNILNHIPSLTRASARLLCIVSACQRGPYPTEPGQQCIGQ